MPASGDRHPVVAIFNVNMIGHLNPTFALVVELVDRGCRVHYFLPPVENIRDAAVEAGAVVEAFVAGDPADFCLETCGVEGRDSVREEERAMYDRAVWPLASTLAAGDHILERCRELGVDVVLYDPTTPHGLLVSELLGIPCVSLVTFPGIGSIAPMLAEEGRLRRMAELRGPLGAEILRRWGVDVGDQMLSRRQYFAGGDNLVTTCADLVAPMPAPGEQAWADEVREHFHFTPVGCMVSEFAPHIISAKAPKDLVRDISFGHSLPEEDLDPALERGARVVFVALGTMAMGERWGRDLGALSGGNLPKGCTGKAFCQHIWSCLFKALEELGDAYHCVVSGGSQADALDFLGDAAHQRRGLPANVTMRSFVPQVEMLKTYAHAFVSHAGFNSMQESLMAGVPLIAIPQALDQPQNAGKIAASGWGVAFCEPMRTVTKDSLKKAIVEVAREGSPYAQACASAKDQLQGGEKRAADRLMQLAGALPMPSAMKDKQKALQGFSAPAVDTQRPAC